MGHRKFTPSTTTAAEMVRRLARDDSEANVVEMMSLAVQQDLTALNKRADGDEERLEKVEAVTKTLAEAIMVIAATDKSVEPAVNAVKAILKGGRTAEKPDDPA
jgi:hypothetical protein